MEAMSFSSTNSSTEESEGENQERIQHKEKLQTKLRKIKDRSRKRMVKEIEGKRFLRKKISKSTKTILKVALSLIFFS
jgi:hypothetical protein